MRKTSLMMCCSAALVLGVAGCNADRTDDTLVDRPMITEPTRPMDTAPATDTTTMGQTMQQGAAMLSVATGAAGEYLADNQGRALYMLEGDRDGSGCTGPCLEAWPPLRADQTGTAGTGTGAMGTGTTGTGTTGIGGTGTGTAGGGATAGTGTTGTGATGTGATGITGAGTIGVTGAQGNLRTNLIGTIQRADGTTQVTYNGHPLYRFARDTGAGTTAGHGMESQWGQWYLVTPAGDAMQHGG